MAKDTEFSNQSTWMLLVDNEELEARLLPVAGKRSVPIQIKIQSFGSEIPIKHYTSFTVKDLLAQVSEISGLQANKIKLKVVEEVLTRRIDTQLYQKETLTMPIELRVLNTLNDVKLSHNAVLFVEEKNEEEIGEEQSTIACN